MKEILNHNIVYFLLTLNYIPIGSEEDDFYEYLTTIKPNLISDLLFSVWLTKAGLTNCLVPVIFTFKIGSVSQ